MRAASFHSEQGSVEKRYGPRGDVPCGCDKQGPIREMLAPVPCFPERHEPEKEASAYERRERYGQHDANERRSEYHGPQKEGNGR